MNSPNRRQALQALGASALLPLGAHAATTDIGRFDAAAARHPWLLPFKGLDAAAGDLHTASLPISGQWPADLRGRFYRNGPALNERGGRRYQHWFDGDGMVQQFSIGGAAGRPVIAHRGRWVQTTKLKAEHAAGKFLINGFGTGIAPDERLPMRGPDSMNVANTSVHEFAGRVLALWEGGSAHALDPADLRTLGPVTWGEGLEQVPFSAHPKIDAQGNLWNFGAFGPRLVVWHIDAQGKLQSARVGEMPLPGAMAHDMAVTAQYLVLPIPPMTLHFERLRGANPDSAFQFHADQPLRILVMRKDDISQRRVFELPTQMLFHVGNAFEHADGNIELSFVSSPGPGALTGAAISWIRGDVAAGDSANSSTQRVLLDMRTGKARIDSFADAVEFPCIDPRRVGLNARWLVSAASWRSGRDSQMFHGLQMRDMHSGREQRFDFGDSAVVEEHIVVPKPGRGAELDAWLLGTSFDVAHRRTVLNVFDAARLADGPVARATLPYWLPYGFHGSFAASRGEPRA